MGGRITSLFRRRGCPAGRNISIENPTFFVGYSEVFIHADKTSGLQASIIRTA
jgi:hypothetical protein